MIDKAGHHLYNGNAGGLANDMIIELAIERERPAFEVSWRPEGDVDLITQ